jgi:hypothetical protein
MRFSGNLFVLYHDDVQLSCSHYISFQKRKVVMLEHVFSVSGLEETNGFIDILCSNCGFFLLRQSFSKGRIIVYIMIHFKYCWRSITLSWNWLNLVF